MKFTLAAVLLGTGLVAASALLAANPGGGVLAPHSAGFGPDAGLSLVDSDDDHEGEDDDGWWWSADSDRDDDDDCADRDEDDDDGDDCPTDGAAAAAPGVTPPRNRLFTDGTTPSVTSN